MADQNEQQTIKIEGDIQKTEAPKQDPALNQMAEGYKENKKPTFEDRKREAELRAEEVAAQHKAASIKVYEQAMHVQTTFMNPAVWTQIRTMGKVFFESHALPSSIKNEAQLVMVMQSGFEMGMKPIESLQSLYIVNGAITIWGKAVTRRLRVFGWRIKYLDESENSCSAVVSKGSGDTLEEYSETYTYDMAVKSGYTKTNDGGDKIGWRPGLNRKLKLRYGALSMIIKSYIAEVLGSAEDIKELAEDDPILAQEADIAAETVTTTEKPITTGSLASAIADSRKPKEPVDEKAETKDNTVKEGEVTT